MQVGFHMSRIAPPNAVESSPMSQRTEFSEPAGGFCLRVTLTVFEPSAPLIVAPLAVEMLSVEIVIGVVIVASSPMPKGAPPGALFPMTTAIAPAS